MNKIEQKFFNMITSDAYDQNILMELSHYLAEKQDPRAEIIDIEIELKSGNPILPECQVLSWPNE